MSDRTRWPQACDPESDLALAIPAFEVIILAFPSVKPITALNMNYSSVITVGVMVCSGIWYICGARKHYHGPQPNVDEHAVPAEVEVSPYEDQKLGSDDRDPTKDYQRTDL